jgi:hypothetical protein
VGSALLRRSRERRGRRPRDRVARAISRGVAACVSEGTRSTGTRVAPTTIPAVMFHVKRSGISRVCAALVAVVDESRPDSSASAASPGPAMGLNLHEGRSEASRLRPRF